MNAASKKPQMPPMSAFIVPIIRKTDAELAQQEQDAQMVDGVSETPVVRAMQAAGKSDGKGQGRARKEKTATTAAAPASAPVEAPKISYPWQGEGMSTKKVFSTRLPQSLQAKMKFLVAMSGGTIGIEELVTEAVQEKVSAMLKSAGIAE